MPTTWNPRPLVPALVACAAIFAVALKMGVWSDHQPDYIPRFFDQVQLGMTVADLQELGGRPYDVRSPAGPPQVEFSPPPERVGSAVRIAGGDPFVADTRFVDGQLAYFELRTSDNFAGRLVRPGKLTRLVPVLAEAAELRRDYAQADLVKALGEGVRVARVLDADRGVIDVYRWDVEQSGRRLARLEAQVAGGLVIAHAFSQQ